MKHYGLVGEKLGHSLSEPIHRAIFDMLGIDADYRLIEIPRADFPREAAALMDRLDGFNVTIPYKRDVMPLLAGVDDMAQSVGAVNTVDARARRGYNTDVPGFEAMLLRAGMDPAGQACFVLGTGGASLAVCAALRRMGAARVTRVSRHPAGDDVGYDALPEQFSGLLVNTTPAGMWPDTSGCPLPQDILERVLPRASGVADVIYNPPETCLTLAAKARGIPACTGLYMLIRQAVEAERIWQGRPMPSDLTDILMKELKLL